jgi:N-acetylglucosaminyldiphosphoundecaprenol N-acetyl-beta-D-mannosaminyltransferase
MQATHDRSEKSDMEDEMSPSHAPSDDRSRFKLSVDDDLLTEDATTLPGSAARVALAGLEFDRLSEARVVRYVIEALQIGRGGWIATPNIDICRQTRRNPADRVLVASATLIVPDGMPLLWAARLRNERLPERVTGSSLIYSLTSAAERGGRSIYLLGGKPGVPDLAGAELSRRYPGLKVAGAAAPLVGFDETTEGVTAIRDSLLLAAPDIVYVGLGFPKQERLIAQLSPALPQTWFVACGAAIPFAAGTLPRAPKWMQRSGLEWAFRLLREPRRLFRRYIIDDLPYAAGLLLPAAAYGIRARLSSKAIQLQK